MGKLERKKNILGVSHFWFVVGIYIIILFFFSFFQTAVLWFEWNYLGKEKRRESDKFFFFFKVV